MPKHDEAQLHAGDAEWGTGLLDEQVEGTDDNETARYGGKIDDDNGHRIVDLKSTKKKLSVLVEPEAIEPDNSCRVVSPIVRNTYFDLFES